MIVELGRTTETVLVWFCDSKMSVSHFYRENRNLQPMSFTTNERVNGGSKYEHPMGNTGFSN